MNKKLLLYWLMTSLWMAFIFYLSHQPASESSNLSSGVLHMVLAALEKVIPTSFIDMEQWHFLIRKSAHLFAYFILGMLMLHSLRKSGLNRHDWFLAWVFSTLYAISDEFHQSFIPGRGPQVSDVLIDSVGAIVGIGIYIFIVRWRKRKERKR